MMEQRGGAASLVLRETDAWPPSPQQHGRVTDRPPDRPAGARRFIHESRGAGGVCVWVGCGSGWSAQAVEARASRLVPTSVPTLPAEWAAARRCSLLLGRGGWTDRPLHPGLRRLLPAQQPARAQPRNAARTAPAASHRQHRQHPTHRSDLIPPTASHRQHRPHPNDRIPPTASHRQHRPHPNDRIPPTAPTSSHRPPRPHPTDRVPPTAPTPPTLSNQQHRPHPTDRIPPTSPTSSHEPLRPHPTHRSDLIHRPLRPHLTGGGGG